MTRLLVTGGAGFIGGLLTRSLLDDGYDVDVVDVFSTGHRENLPDGARLLEVDLAAVGATDRLPRDSYEAVLHLAGQASGEKSFDDPLFDFDLNARATLALALWARERDVPAFLYASSMAVYGDVASHPVNEEEPTRPVSFYGGSKLAAERALEIVSRGGLKTCALRLFSVYGPGQNLADLRQGMVSIYLSYILRGEPVEVRGSLERVRDLVYVDDVVAAWRAALDRKASGVFNIGTGIGTSVGDLIRDIALACDAGADYPCRVVDGTPGDQFAVSADTSRAAADLGWSARVPLQEGLARTVAWARQR
jgi:UDP-glucose 4-epimerase